MWKTRNEAIFRNATLNVNVNTMVREIKQELATFIASMQNDNNGDSITQTYAKQKKAVSIGWTPS